MPSKNNWSKKKKKLIQNPRSAKKKRVNVPN